MTAYEVGYGKPPKHSQFKKGICPNPRGRGRRSVSVDEEILKNVLYAPTEYRENGRSKKAPRLEIEIKKLGAAACRGDVDSAAKLLKMHAHARAQGDTAAKVIVITGGLPKDGQPLALPPDLHEDSDQKI